VQEASSFVLILATGMIQLTVTRRCYRSLQEIETFDGFHHFFLFVKGRLTAGIRNGSPIVAAHTQRSARDQIELSS
jgi:hypothetical protein